jgi:hypothetical protein
MACHIPKPAIPAHARRTKRVSEPTAPPRGVDDEVRLKCLPIDDYSGHPRSRHFNPVSVSDHHRHSRLRRRRRTKDPLENHTTNPESSEIRHKRIHRRRQRACGEEAIDHLWRLCQQGFAHLRPEEVRKTKLHHSRTRPFQRGCRSSIPIDDAHLVTSPSQSNA